MHKYMRAPSCEKKNSIAPPLPGEVSVALRCRRTLSLRPVEGPHRANRPSIHRAHAPHHLPIITLLHK